MANFDSLIIGGGVVGLSLAYELARQGERVAVTDRGPIGRQASWAGAGILPPANRATAHHPYDELRGLAVELHAKWAVELRTATGIDTGYRRCGAVYLGRTPGEAASLHGFAGLLRDEHVRIERLDEAALADVEPALAGTLRERRARAAYFLPDEAQLRNPRHLRALEVAGRKLGVEYLQETEIVGWRCAGDRVIAARTAVGEIAAEKFCVTAGAWTRQLLLGLNAPTGVLPIRGQMLLFRTAAPPCHRVLNDGPRYVVPRDDGHVLVGSTEEEVGFDCRTTPEGVADLERFARELVPGLRSAELVRAWAGLRPASFDHLPYLGSVPEWRNAYAAAGHFRSGLYLSPATAVVVGQVMRGLRPEIDLAPFQLRRG